MKHFVCKYIEHYSAQRKKRKNRKRKKQQEIILNYNHDVIVSYDNVQDDVIDEVDHLVAAAHCLKERGAYKVYAIATHGIFSEEAPEQLEDSFIDEVWCCLGD